MNNLLICTREVLYSSLGDNNIQVGDFDLILFIFFRLKEFSYTFDFWRMPAIVWKSRYSVAEYLKSIDLEVNPTTHWFTEESEFKLKLMLGDKGYITLKLPVDNCYN